MTFLQELWDIFLTKLCFPLEDKGHLKILIQLEFEHDSTGYRITAIPFCVNVHRNTGGFPYYANTFSVWAAVWEVLYQKQGVSFLPTIPAAFCAHAQTSSQHFEPQTQAEHTINCKASYLLTFWVHLLRCLVLYWINSIYVALSGMKQCIRKLYSFFLNVACLCLCSTDEFRGAE